MIAIKRPERLNGVPPQAAPPEPSVWDKMMPVLINGINNIIRSGKADTAETVKTLSQIVNHLETDKPDKPLSVWEFDCARNEEGRLTKITAKQKA